MKITFVHLLFVLVKINGEKTCSTEVSAEGKLRQTLFCNYNTKVRPVKHRENQTLVHFLLFPVKLHIDEHDEVLSFQGNFFFSWSDQYLNWDPREYEGIDFIAVSSTDIWVPDITFDSWLQSTSFLTDSSAAKCHLTHVGEVYCFTRTTLQNPCSPDITYFPYDIQNCSLTFLPSDAFLNNINFTLYDTNNGIRLSLYKPNKAWELKEAKSVRRVKYLGVENGTVPFPMIRSYFVLKRHSALHTAVYVLPGAALASLCLFVFWIDTMYTVRVVVGATVLIANSLYTLILGIILPSSGDKVPLIVTFYRDSLLMASYAMMVTMFVRCLRMKTELPSHWVTETLSKMESITVIQVVFLGKGSGKEEDSEEIIENSKKKTSAWDQLATFVDRISFVLCCFVYLLLLFFYLP